MVDGTIVGLQDVRPVLYVKKRIGWTSRIRVYWWYNGTIHRMSILSYMETKGQDGHVGLECIGYNGTILRMFTLSYVHGNKRIGQRSRIRAVGGTMGQSLRCPSCSTLEEKDRMDMQDQSVLGTMGRSFGCPSCSTWEEKDRMDKQDQNVLVVQWDNPKDVHPVLYTVGTKGQDGQVGLVQWGNPKDVHPVLYRNKRIGWTSRISIMGQSLGCPSCLTWEQKDRMDKQGVNWCYNGTSIGCLPCPTNVYGNKCIWEQKNRIDMQDQSVYW